MKFQSDIDIDFADRAKALAVLENVPASILRDGELIAHNTGVYVTSIPRDPFSGRASLDYKIAEERGYVKMDFLNVSLYERVQDEEHLTQLMETVPNWARFNTDQQFFQKLMHVSNHWAVLKRMPEPVDSIPRLAMFLAIIRPAKRHLIGETWAKVAETIWEKAEDGYQFKRSHAVAYAQLVAVNMNLDELGNFTN